MSCPYCKSESKRFGKHRNGLQRFRCISCKKTFTEDHELAFRIEDYLKESRGIMAIQLLVESCSIRTAERITGLHRDAIMRLLLAAGSRAQKVMDTLVQNVKATDVQADEIWGFIGKLVRLEPNDPPIRSALYSGYALEQWYAFRKFGPNYVKFRTPLTNIRLTTFVCHETEVKVIDTNKLEVIEAVGCKLREVCV